LKIDVEFLIIDLYNKGLTYKEIRKQVPYSNATIARVATKHNLPRRQAESFTKAMEAEIELNERKNTK